MLSLSEISKKLGGNGKVHHSPKGDCVKVPGPGHSANDDSLTIWLTDDGEDIRVHSHAGDNELESVDWVREQLGLPKWEPKKKKANGNGRGNGKSGAAWTDISEHVYCAADGKPYGMVKKCLDGNGKKQYPQYHWDDGGQLQNGKHPGPKIPYMLPELIKAQVSIPIYFCEGEKDADALAKIGLVATTASEGAKAPWDKAMTEYFAGRTVIILPDADIPGRKHAQKVANALAGTAYSIKVLDLFPDRDDGYDVSDFLRHDTVGAQLTKLAKKEPEWMPADTKKQEDDMIAELEGLTGIDQAKRKKEIAKELGISGKDLEKVLRDKSTEAQPEHWPVEPWPEPVSIEALLDQLEEFYATHVILPEHGAVAMALWCMHAWTIDAAYTSPFLTFTSPEMRCGKSTAMEALLWTAPRTVMASNISPSAFYRYIDRDRPTLLIDEAETHTHREDTRGILDGGHTRASAHTIRCVGDASEPKLFSTWGPKVIAGIGKMQATIRDRSIIILMKRKKTTEKVKRLRGRDTDEFRALRQQACRWAKDNIATLKEAEPARPGGLNDRAADHWEPLFAIADLAGDEWAAKARAAALALSGDNDAETDSLGVQLLAAIKDLMEGLNAESVVSQAVVEHLHKDESGPWLAYGKMQKPITQRQVSDLLKPYGIKPRTIRDGWDTKKGYKFAWLKAAFEAYLPAPSSQSVTPSQCNGDKELAKISSATPEKHVTDEEAAKCLSPLHCDSVTDRKPPISENGGETASDPCADRMACRYCDGPADGTEVTCSVVGVEVSLHSKCVDGWLAAAKTMSAEEMLKTYR
jgi:5S rRNA maturation endonuclease (ribonuclease M5)